MVVTKSALVGGYYPFWVSESQFLPYIRSTNVWGKAMEGRLELNMDYRGYMTRGKRSL